MDDKCTAAEAVQRGYAIFAAQRGQYGLGSGDYHPASHWTPAMANADVPWTRSPDAHHRGPASDCAGFAICYAWKLKRHRPGFNNGAWASVSDDINVNSAIEDGDHKRELFDSLDGQAPLKPGDLICYVPNDFKAGDKWARLTILQCCGPDGRTPAVLKTDAHHWDDHDKIWPKAIHRTVIVRPKER
jgi:hypothetical protein